VEPPGDGGEKEKMTVPAAAKRQIPRTSLSACAAPLTGRRSHCEGREGRCKRSSNGEKLDNWNCQSLVLVTSGRTE